LPQRPILPQFKINLEHAKEDEDRKRSNLLYAAAIKDGALKPSSHQQPSRTVSVSEPTEEAKGDADYEGETRTKAKKPQGFKKGRGRKQLGK